MSFTFPACRIYDCRIMADSLSQIKEIGCHVRTATQYKEISESLFDTHNPIRYMFVFQVFTYFVMSNQVVKKQDITSTYNSVWWVMFKSTNFLGKLRLVFWRYLGPAFIEKFVLIP